MNKQYKRKAMCNTKFMFDGSELEIVKQYKYLGVFLDEYLDFNVTANVLAGAAGRVLGAVLSKLRNFGNIGFKSFTKVFDSSVLPVLEYASEIWGYKDNIQGERILQRASRYYMQCTS